MIIRPNSNITMDFRSQNTRRNPTNPAKMVKNGGPWASDFSFLESPPTGPSICDANTTTANLCLALNRNPLLNLEEKGVKGKLKVGRN